MNDVAVKTGLKIVTGIGTDDPLWHLLDDPAIVLAADACPVHLHRVHFELAALRCLSHADFLKIDRPGRRERLYGRVRWLLPAATAAWWDRRLAAPEPAGFHAPVDAAEFEILKIRANRLQVVERSLPELLAGLPEGFADKVLRTSGCEPEKQFRPVSGALQARTAE